MEQVPELGLKCIFEGEGIMLSEGFAEASLLVFGDLGAVLRRVWLASDQLCSKRLKAALPIWLPYYERRYEPLNPELQRRVLAISPATTITFN